MDNLEAAQHLLDRSQGDEGTRPGRKEDLYKQAQVNALIAIAKKLQTNNQFQEDIRMELEAINRKLEKLNTSRPDFIFTTGGGSFPYPGCVPPGTDPVK